MPGRPMVALLVLLVTAASCARPLPDPDWIDPAPAPDSVTSVVFLIGDAGDALPGRSPVTAKLGREVERWSAALARDSAVVVFFLGDNVYPDGVHDPSDPGFVVDSLKLLSQVLTLAGEQARRFAAHGYFIAGNHDWGGRPGAGAVRRLRNQAALIEAFREQGHDVRLVPEAGAPGPVVLDVGPQARFVAMDTQWWLYDRERTNQDRVLRQLAESLETAEERSVAVVAHHPFMSGGLHGGGASFWAGYGVFWLLRKAGAVVQSLNSAPYRDLRRGLERVFREAGAPLLFVAGHDHSLQALVGQEPDEPRWNLVSGAGSRTNDVGFVPGMIWGAERPGFMRLTYVRSGAVHLHVLATDADLAVCEGEGAARLECMERAIERFQLVYARTLRP